MPSMPFYAWAIAGVLLLFSELLIPGFFTLFFGLGAFVAAIACLLFPALSLNQQLLVFLISSICLLVLLRRWLKNVFTGFTTGRQKPGTNLTEHVGKRVVVRERITRERPGKVELNGTDWRAEADVTCEVDDLVRIIGQDNLTVRVAPTNPEAAPEP